MQNRSQISTSVVRWIEYQLTLCWGMILLIVLQNVNINLCCNSALVNIDRETILHWKREEHFAHIISPV